MKISKVVLTAVVLGGMVMMVTGIRTFMKVSGEKGPSVSAKVLGDPRAPVKIVEFTDFQCPACAKASTFVHAEMKKEGAGIFLELKYFPLPMHKHAMGAAVAAECALRQGKFWPMQNLLFEDQKTWSQLADPRDYFLGLARELGADDAQMTRCMADQAVAAKVSENVKEGKALGVQATPTFFVNGRIAVGTMGLEQALKEAVK